MPPEHRPPVAAWLAPALIGLVGLIVFAAAGMARPTPNRPVAALLLPGSERDVLSRLLEADPGLRLVEFAWGGTVAVLTYQRADLPKISWNLGVLMLVDAAAAGCQVRG